jgi:hypothetical protein
VTCSGYLLAIMAIVVGCMGLFGLAAFSAEQRTKEIGHQEGTRCKCDGHYSDVVKRFFKTGFYCDHHRLADCMVLHEQMVAGFPLPQRLR